LADWSKANPLPPWLSHIQEGSSKGVAFVLGQSLKPDGQPPSVLTDRALRAKELLDSGKVDSVIVSGGDTAGVGHSEAYEMSRVLQSIGIREDLIIMESQATTTAENIWFGLRWIPEGTGQLYIVTSDFHMARAMYIFNEVLGYFYKTFEDKYLADPRFTPSKDGLRRYPQLVVHLAVVKSYCGSDPTAAVGDRNKSADISTKSLALRASDELRFLGSGEVVNSLYGPPRSPLQYIWARQIDVDMDPHSAQNYQDAMRMSMNVAEGLCHCLAPPEHSNDSMSESSLHNPLVLPLSTNRADGSRVVSEAAWRGIVKRCPPRQELDVLRPLYRGHPANHCAPCRGGHP